ncbi:unnamed protein product [Discosporangium mesarthrocarpum]
MDTFLAPTLQLPSLGIRRDEEVTAAVLREAAAGGWGLGMSTAYLNLPETLLGMLLNPSPPPSLHPLTPPGRPGATGTTITSASSEGCGVSHGTGARGEQPGAPGSRQKRGGDPAPPQGLGESGGGQGGGEGELQHDRRAVACPGSGTTLVTAGPSSHGFSGAGGWKAAIPLLYDRLAGDLLKRSTPKTKPFHCPNPNADPGASASSGRVGEEERLPGGESSVLRVLEWQREGWTFHAKGLWVLEDLRAHGNVDPNSQVQTPTPALRCLLSVCGSSNFGRRSTERDLESQLMVVTHNRRLSEELGREWGGLLRRTTGLTLQGWQGRQGWPRGCKEWPRGKGFTRNGGTLWAGRKGLALKTLTWVALPFVRSFL